MTLEDPVVTEARKSVQRLQLGAYDWEQIAILAFIEGARFGVNEFARQLNGESL